MKRNGFTLIEILAVIVILGILGTIVSINVIKIKDDSMEDLLETKIQNLEASAVVYGQENPNILTESCVVDNLNYSSCAKVKVDDLIKGSYFKSTEVNNEGNVDLINNVTKESMLNDNIQIYRKNNSIYAKYIGK